MTFLMQIVPCVVLALLIHPSTSHHFVNRVFWAFCVYLEAVSVLPQLRVMQNTKVWYCITKLNLLALKNYIFWEVLTELFPISYFQIVEPFTAHYVFALGIARFLSCAHWVLQVWFSLVSSWHGLYCMFNCFYLFMIL